jgi:hypothetical protein
MRSDEKPNGRILIRAQERKVLPVPKQKVRELGFETDKPISPYGICLSPDGGWLFYTQADRSDSSVMIVENCG